MWRISKLLSEATEQDRQDLAQILKCKNDPTHLCQAFVNLAGNVIGLRPKPVTYGEILREVARNSGVEADNIVPLKIVERRLVQLLFERIWDKMSPSEREEFAKKYHEGTKNHSWPKTVSMPVLSIVALTGAQMSGFGVYMQASILVGAVTGALEITLPFAFYMGMSQVISIAIGPLGGAAVFLLSVIKLRIGLSALQKNKASRLLGAILFIITLKTRDADMTQS